MKFQTTLLWAIFALFLGFSACQNAAIETPFDPNIGGAPTNPDEQLLASLINDIRAAGETCSGVQLPSVGALTFNETLNSVAEKHAEYMNNIDELTHIGEDNSSVGDRLTTEGYAYSVAAENLAKGFADEASLIDAWQNSEGHCENIMNGLVMEMGVGTAGDYWVLVFAAE